MKEGRRQKQVGALLMEELSRIFQKLGLNMIHGGMVSISSVKVTPDLFEARGYLSFYAAAGAAEGVHLWRARGCGCSVAGAAAAGWVPGGV